MKPLPTQFTKHGWQFQQIARSGNRAVFKKTKGKASSFEVITIQQHNGYTIAGVTIPPAETYPSSEQWGTYGHTSITETAAMDRFHATLSA